MQNGQPWMAKKHARTGVAHDHSNPGTHLWFVTMSWTFRTGGLALLIGAVLQPDQGIVQQFLALRA